MGNLQVVDMDANELRGYLNARSEDSYALIDVREPKEYKKGHLPGAILMPLKEVETNIVNIELEKELVFYCRSGRRSRVAATFVADLGLGFPNIFNLKGGILSWDGKVLSDLPRIEIFADIDSALLDQLLYKAIELEKGAETFYLMCAQILDSEQAKSMALTLSKLEVRHAKVIYEMLKEIKDDIPSFEEMYKEADDKLLEGGLTVVEAIDKLTSVSGDVLIGFGELAIEIEYMAYDLYKNLAQKAKTSQEASIFFNLAQQEKGHIRIIASRLS